MERNLHYDAGYLEWQREQGRFGGRANLFLFEPFVESGDRLVEFGAGAGFLLEQLHCASKVGVEINPAARAEAEARGLSMVDTFARVPDESADVVVSSHALEHVDEPLAVLREVLRVLRPGGQAVFVVPCEASPSGYEAGDINLHLYTWSPMNLGNLFARAGFRTLEASAVFHKWPPGYRTVQKLLGWGGFHLCARAWGRVARQSFQVRCVAVKPEGRG